MHLVSPSRSILQIVTGIYIYTFAFTIQFQDNPPKYCDLRHPARKYLSFYSHSGHVETVIDSIKVPFFLN
jgi:hypothetical protein